MSDLSSSSTAREPATEVHQLRRSQRDRVVGGVCGGLGRYLQVDPVLLRIVAVALALSGGFGLLAYVIAWIVIPEETDAEPVGPARPESRHGFALVAGAALVCLGAILVLRELVPWFSAAYFWPVVIVGIGVVVLATASR